MRLRFLAAASLLVALAAGCGSGGSSSTSSQPPGRDVGAAQHSDGQYQGHGAYINPIDFTVTNGTVTGMHGMVTLNCTVGDRTGNEQSAFTDPRSIRVDSTGSFADDYQYAIGNGTWTLHVQGTLTGDGRAAGFMNILGVGCSTSTNGWAAAVNGAALPAIPTAPPATPTDSCSPQPCATKGGVTVSVQNVAAVTERDDPTAHGVDVTFSVANAGGTDVTIENSFTNFTLRFGSSEVVDHSYAFFVDANGQDVPCLRSTPVHVFAGQQVQGQHICFLLSHDESGQPMSFVWEYAGPPFVVPIGTLG